MYFLITRSLRQVAGINVTHGYWNYPFPIYLNPVSTPPLLWYDLSVSSGQGGGAEQRQKTINKNSAVKVLKFHSCSFTAPNFNKCSTTALTACLPIVMLNYWADVPAHMLQQNWLWSRAKWLFYLPYNQSCCPHPHSNCSLLDWSDGSLLRFPLYVVGYL